MFGCTKQEAICAELLSTDDTGDYAKPPPPAHENQQNATSAISPSVSSGDAGLQPASAEDPSGARETEASLSAPAQDANTTSTQDTATEGGSGEAGDSGAEAVPLTPTKAKETPTPPGHAQGDVNSGGVSPANASASDDASPGEVESPQSSKVPEPGPTATEVLAPRPVTTPSSNDQDDVDCGEVPPASVLESDASPAETEPPQSSEAPEPGPTATEMPALRPVTTEPPTSAVQKMTTARDVADDSSARPSLPPTPQPAVDDSESGGNS
jgi:hypothetical protein